MAVSKDADGNADVLMPPRREHDFALVVGVEDYPRFRSLNGAINDAKRFHDWVCSEDGGGVDPANGRLITSIANPAAPVQYQIDGELVKLMEAADKVGGGRRLYFYFSGHGATDEGRPQDNVALMLAQWERTLRVALSSAAYSSKLSCVGLFEEIVVFLDCCRNTTEGSIGLPPMFDFKSSAAPCSTRMFVAYATEAGHSAFENRSNGEWQGVFTRCLLAILRGAPMGIEAAALKDRLEGEVPESLPGQQAHVRNELRSGAKFGRRGVVPQLRITFRRVGTRVKLFDGSLNLIAEHEATPEPWVLSLQAGLYLLEDASSSKPISHRQEGTHVEL
jgi:hypothetical protein